MWMSLARFLAANSRMVDSALLIGESWTMVLMFSFSSASLACSLVALLGRLSLRRLLVNAADVAGDFLEMSIGILLQYLADTGFSWQHRLSAAGRSCCSGSHSLDVVGVEHGNHQPVLHFAQRHGHVALGDILRQQFQDLGIDTGRRRGSHTGFW